jgi:hypothetical protein
MKIAVIDLDSIAFTIGHPNKQLDENGDPMRTDDNSKFLYIDKTEQELIDCTDSIMSGIIMRGGFTHYIGFIKGSKTIAERKEINNDYKANRGKESPGWWGFVKNTLIERWGAISVDNMEVDDAVNITRLKLSDSYIVAMDKDLLYLHGTHYNWSRDLWSIVGFNEAYTKFWSDMITGQSGDNIKGIPKKGPKYVESMLNEDTKIPFMNRVFNEYIKHFGEYEGIKEFYKNYSCLKIKETCEGFEIPSPIEFDRENINEPTQRNQQIDSV